MRQPELIVNGELFQRGNNNPSFWVWNNIAYARMANTKKKKMQQLKRKRSLAERVASHVICWKRTPTPNNLRHYPSRATTSPPLPSCLCWKFPGKGPRGQAVRPRRGDVWLIEKNKNTQAGRLSLLHKSASVTPEEEENKGDKPVRPPLLGSLERARRPQGQQKGKRRGRTGSCTMARCHFHVQSDWNVTNLSQAPLTTCLGERCRTSNETEASSKRSAVRPRWGPEIIKKPKKRSNSIHL